MGRLQRLYPVLAGVAMIMAVVVINGRPSVFTDTDDYFVEGRTFAYTIGYALHLKTPPPPPTDPDDIADAKQAAADLRMSHTEIGARSPYYGLFLYATQRIGTIWLTTLLQTVVGAWLVFMLWRTALPGAPRWSAYAMQAAVAFGSTLPFFTSFMMPDVFAGYTAVSGILLLVYWERLKTGERWMLALLLGLSMTFHTSHVLDTAALAVASAGLLWLFRANRRQAAMALATVGLAIVAASAASAIYKEAVFLKTGDELRRPPFMAMRMLADGPGRRYLRWACDHGETYVLCQFRKLPLDDSQDLLWSDDRTKGIFNVSTIENRLKMEREENRFIIHAFLFDPVGQIWASIYNWADQLTMVSLDDPLRNPHYFLTNEYWSTTNLPWLINHADNCGRDHTGCASRLSIDGSFWLHSILFVAAVLLVVIRLFRSDMVHGFKTRDFPWAAERTRLLTLLILLMFVVVVNAFVCGALSGAFARYQARITWLATAAATISMLSLLPMLSKVTMPAWLSRLWTLPVVQLAARRIDPAFLRFGLVGAAGFVVDFGVLNLMTEWVGLTPIEGRLVSFPVAVMATWLLNRSFTFRHHASHHTPLRQALVYAGVQLFGGVANFAVYTLVLKLAPALDHMLVVPLAFGAAAGLCLNFLGSKHFAFKVGAKRADAGLADILPHDAPELTAQRAD